MMPILPSALFNRNREKCPSKCGLCRKRCPAHLEIDGDTPLSGECICCHACQVTCPRKNIQIGPVKETGNGERMKIKKKSAVMLCGVFCTALTAVPVLADIEVQKYTNTDFAMDTVVSETLYTTGDDLNTAIGQKIRDIETEYLSLERMRISDREN